MINSISISISDEDDLSGRVRLPPRPRRRKTGRNARPGPLRRFSRVLIRWWPVFFLAASVFLFFKVSKHMRRAPDIGRVTLDKGSREDPELEGSIGNLNRLDPVTRAVRGGRERKSLLVGYFITSFVQFGKRKWQIEMSTGTGGNTILSTSAIKLLLRTHLPLKRKCLPHLTLKCAIKSVN